MTDDLWQKAQEEHWEKCKGKCLECQAEIERLNQVEIERLNRDNYDEYLAEQDSLFHYLNR